MDDYLVVARRGGGQNRRLARRYSLQLELGWKLLGRNRVRETGTGHTVNLSSDGILVDVGVLPVRTNIELSISWPALLDSTIPMRLVAWGKVVRSNGNGSAIEIAKHEFRTRRLDRTPWSSARTPVHTTVVP